MSSVTKTAVLGTGVIGASWAALFLAHGADVAAHDPAEGAEERLRAAIDAAWPSLEALGMVAERPGRLSVHVRAGDAVEGAEFIQESVPERVEIKHALYAEIEDAVATDAVVASSASGLTLSEMQGGWRDPARFVLGHPFNPPHLIPLVEVMGNEMTAPGVVEAAEAAYAQFGKVTIRVLREVPGHVANRLQAAVWREAIHLVSEGVATVADVDKAMAAGPGLRWAAMGPTMLFHLGAGPGGLEQFCERYAPSFHRWWDDLGDPRLDAATAKAMAEGVAEAARGRSVEELSAERDALIRGYLATARGR